jgi:thiol-disulfide isomerase/thioredoxin
MNTDNLSALAVGIAVVALIAGFGVYFNSPELNAAGNGEFITAAVGENGKLAAAIDKSQFRPAPELAGISNYINSADEFKMSDLKGKVVLVDFWTYSCINCIRTIPYLNAWHEKYSDEGLVIVGIHAPEFDFEKSPENVRAAVEKFGIKYAVVQDDEHETWDAYQNRYWPRKYLVDDEGYIRYDHIGEGAYEKTEKVIQSLLRERAAGSGQQIAAIDGSMVRPDAQSVDFGSINTPELYFGYDFARDPLGNPEGFRPEQAVKYSIADDQEFEPNLIYLSGEWENKADYMELKSGVGRIVLEYSAKSVNIVAGSAGTVYVSVDGKSPFARGADVGEDGTFSVEEQRLYNVASHKTYGEHRIIMDVAGEGFQIYTFTFG